MIDFSLEPELELLRETARRFAREHLWPEQRAHESARTLPAKVRDAFGQIGLAMLELPEALGGAGLGTLARVMVLEELAAGDAGAVLALDPFGPALYPLLELGDEDDLKTLALPLLDRQGSRAVLVTDLSEQLIGQGRTISGEVPWIPADSVDLLVVLGRQGACVLSEGIATEPLRGAGLRAAGASSLVLENAPVVAAWQDAAGAGRALARTRLHTAATLLGVMRAAADYSRDYAVERTAFGKPIAHHQALAFLIADMATAVEATRLLVWEAAWKRDRGEDEDDSAVAYIEASEQAMFVTPNALQILGGHGFVQDHPVEKMMREARTLGLMAGGVDCAREDATNRLEQEAEVC